VLAEVVQHARKQVLELVDISIFELP
jgi:hypothetical protein